MHSTFPILKLAWHHELTRAATTSLTFEQDFHFCLCDTINNHVISEMCYEVWNSFQANWLVCNWHNIINQKLITLQAAQCFHSEEGIPIMTVLPKSVAPKIKTKNYSFKRNFQKIVYTSFFLFFTFSVCVVALQVSTFPCS